MTAHSAHSYSPPGNLSPAPKEGTGQPLSPRTLQGPRRKAWSLLVFGVLVAVVCTRATLTAVQQEAEVVQLAQQLAASEAAVSPRRPLALNILTCSLQSSAMTIEHTRTEDTYSAGCIAVGMPSCV